jgi:hypothetical protein
MSASTPTTIKTPTHTPALKIPPTTAQLLSKKSDTINNNWSIFFIFTDILKSEIKKNANPV